MQSIQQKHDNWPSFVAGKRTDGVYIAMTVATYTDHGEWEGKNTTRGSGRGHIKERKSGRRCRRGMDHSCAVHEGYKDETVEPEESKMLHETLQFGSLGRRWDHENLEKESIPVTKQEIIEFSMNRQRPKRTRKATKMLLGGLEEQYVGIGIEMDFMFN